MSAWMQTYPCRHCFEPLNPDPAKIDIRDIAHALSRIPRFGGHTPVPYSVCQHSNWVSDHCENYPLYGLLHDAPEAYIGDMVRPLKIDMPQFRIVEERNWKAICAAFGMPDTLPAEVKRIDNRAIITERRDLGIVPREPWSADLECLAPHWRRIQNLHRSSEWHRDEFLERFYRLHHDFQTAKFVTPRK